MKLTEAPIIHPPTGIVVCQTNDHLHVLEEAGHFVRPPPSVDRRETIKRLDPFSNRVHLLFILRHQGEGGIGGMGSDFQLHFLVLVLEQIGQLHIFAGPNFVLYLLGHQVV